MKNINTAITPLIDTQGATVEIDVTTEQPFCDIRLFAWRVTEDTTGRPYERYTDIMHLTPEQAVELARRLLNAAAAIG